jgi:hypothetical protein
MGSLRWSMQAWRATGSVMPTQGSSARAGASGTHRGANATAAAADMPTIVLFIGLSFLIL